MRVLVPYLATYGLRPFQQFFPDMLWRVEARARTAYLTFDDGPTAQGTPKILELLARYDAQATHFLLGQHAEEHPDLVRDLAAAGHQVGNHTFSHCDPWTVPQEQLARELDDTTSTLESLVERPIRALRPPYGHPTGFLRHWAAAQNQRMAMWDVMPGDYLQSSTPSRVSRFVINHVRPGSLIVLHDNPVCNDVTPRALETILDTLTRDGWTFDALH